MPTTFLANALALKAFLLAAVGASEAAPALAVVGDQALKAEDRGKNAGIASERAAAD